MSAAAVGTLQIESLEKGLWPRTIQELLAFIGIADKQEADLSVKINALFRQIGQVTDSLILSAIEKRTAVEFSIEAATSFNAYVRVLRAKSDLLQVVLRGDSGATERLVIQSLTELEGEFRNHGAQQFGASVSEQALFTVWTIRKTVAQIWRLFDPSVINTPLPAISVPTAERLGAEFALYSSWAQFHLECLTTSMRLEKVIYPDVLPAIIDGLRSEVNAFAIAKQIVNLHIPVPDEGPDEFYAWDEEDDELLSSSVRDMELEET